VGILLLISGNLGATILKYLEEKISIVAVYTDYESTEIIECCAKNKINIFKGNPRKRREDSIKFIENCHFDILLSVNYLFIIEKYLIDSPKKYAVNIHGSLLPKYRGRTPHIWSIINGEQNTGITAHLLTEELDAGDIIEQFTIPIEQTDTGYSILQKYNRGYIEIIDKLLSGVEKWKFTPQDHGKATYFSKRTPEDGVICWEWQKERIYNWVRALSKPYPGAFCFYNDEKVIINKTTFSNIGFSDTQKNGTILEVSNDRIIVKVSNGAIELFEIENYNKFSFIKGDVIQ
jgi:methionyl-tRNA formyltransferase